MLDLVYEVVATTSICSEPGRLLRALVTITQQIKAPCPLSPHARNTWASNSKNKKTTPLVHFLAATCSPFLFFFSFSLTLLNDNNSTKRFHQIDALSSLTANKCLSFVPQKAYKLLLWGAEAEREIHWSVQAAARWIKVSRVSGQSIKYQIIFLLKSPKSYSTEVKIKLNYCTNTALVAKGLSSCYIYIPEMIVSKITANSFLLSLHAFFPPWARADS